MSDENQSLCFIDSNIWLYALLPKQDETKEAIAKSLIEGNQPDIVISTQVINEIVNNLLRKGRTKESAVRLLIASFYDDYTVVRMDRTIQEKASLLRENHSFSHWDSLVVITALQAGASTIYSEDMQHEFVIDNKLTIVNPFI